MTVLEIMSSNAGSLIKDNRLWRIQQFFRKQSVNILAVQETHLTAESVDSFRSLIFNI
jgi:hypothetical protein